MWSILCINLDKNPPPRRAGGAALRGGGLGSTFFSTPHPLPFCPSQRNTFRAAFVLRLVFQPAFRPAFRTLGRPLRWPYRPLKKQRCSTCCSFGPAVKSVKRKIENVRLDARVAIQHQTYPTLARLVAPPAWSCAPLRRFSAWSCPLRRLLALQRLLTHLFDASQLGVVGDARLDS